MNRSQLNIQRNNVVRLFEPSNLGSNQRNRVRISPGNSLEHELKKLEVCYGLLKEGKEFLTEAVFRDGCGRADIICLDDGIVFEIVDTEGEASLVEKMNKYPLPMEIIRVNPLINRKKCGCRSNGVYYKCLSCDTWLCHDCLKKGGGWCNECNRVRNNE